jgi:hypothetical protein
MKTVDAIKDLVRKQKKDELKKISQQYIKNAWYKVRFQPGDNRGIHGACPSEMLHALLLGMFKYTNECFFVQVGKTSQLAVDIDALAIQYGEYFTRQSERDLPNCLFGEGIKKGTKIMAKEHRGVLLAIAAVLRSKRGRRLLSKNPNFGGRNGAYLKDWMLLMETLLEWEAFLCQPKMKVEDVERLENMNHFIMYLIKKVIRREKGMGLKLMKFHSIIHMVTDIRLYGVPMEHDTGANESHHKPTKVAAKLTQKRIDTFEEQTAIRLIEFLNIQLAMAELDGLALFQYFERPMDEPAPTATTTPEPRTGGSTFEVYEDGDDNPQMDTVRERNKNAKPLVFHLDLVDFMMDLQHKVEEWIPDLEIRSEHRRNGQIFRGHPHYRGKPWRDWAMFDWGDEDDGGWGELPGEIHCFVVLQGLPEQATIKHGGIYLENGTYAVIETAILSKDKAELEYSDLFVPFRKQMGKATEWGRKNRKFYLANVESIVAPLCVVPDVGTTSSYFQVKPRAEWSEVFSEWLQTDDIAF